MQELIEQYQKEVIPQYFDVNPERYIYHYTNAEALISIISNNCLHASNILYMNDLQELQFPLKQISDFVSNNKFSNDNDINEYFRDFYDNKFLSKVVESSKYHFVLSFTLEEDSLHLWNYYGKDDGYAIGFKIKDLMDYLWSKRNKLLNMKDKTSSKSSIFNGKLLYDKQKQISYINDTIKHFNAVILNQIRYQDTEYEKEASLTTALMSINFRSGIYNMKSLPHKLENEFRVSILPDKGYDNYLFKSKNGIIVPYVALNFDKIPVSKIIIGPKVKDEIAYKGVKSLLNQYDFKEVEISKSELKIR